VIPAFFRTGLYVSSFFPLYVFLIINNYEYISTIESLKKILFFEDLLPSIFFLILLLLIAISIMALMVITKVNLNEYHSFEGICKIEDNLLSYVVTYLVPLLSIEITDGKSLLVNFGLFSLLGFIYVKNSLVYLNPLFLFFKYNIYRTMNNEVIISNYTIYELKNIEKRRVKTRVLSYKIYLLRKNEEV
jgi:hypothetical protein